MQSLGFSVLKILSGLSKDSLACYIIILPLNIWAYGNQKTFLNDGANDDE